MTVIRPELPRFGTDSRVAGTADEYKAIVQGRIAYFGAHSLNETDRSNNRVVACLQSVWPTCQLALVGYRAP